MSFDKKTIDDIDIAGKRVLVRVDFNVPLAPDGTVTDTLRMNAALPTIRKIIDSGAKCIIISHLGRPKGRTDVKYSLAPVAKKLAELLDMEITYVGECVGREVEAEVEKIAPGSVMVLENLRFHPEEKKADENFAMELAELADVYINDAFGTAHRAHASTTVIARYLPSAAGYLIKKELEFFGKALSDPVRPFVAILGGAKVSDKLALIENLLDKVDALIVGGGMAYTFLLAQGHPVGSSLLEPDLIEKALEIIAAFKEKGKDFLLPVDLVLAEEIADDAKTEITDLPEVPDGMMGLDIGPKTIQLFSEKIKSAKTIVWNGPMGVFEKEPFAVGTRSLCRALADLDSVKDAVTIIGGGDTAAAVRQFGYAEKMSHISTGGGASLKLLEGKELPGIAALPDREL
ncbi:MAG: phosphoglycerate kinase [Planctomycetota bacterium]|nr:MAG: phosphoglycerate kinase [Planctomycetota bacterium]